MDELCSHAKPEWLVNEGGCVCFAGRGSVLITDCAVMLYLNGKKGVGLAVVLTLLQLLCVCWKGQLEVVDAAAMLLLN
eukprot:1155839-Pelagomonas_calceolata.AAC.18